MLIYCSTNKISKSAKKNLKWLIGLNFNQIISISNLASWIFYAILTCARWSGPLYIWVDICICRTLFSHITDREVELRSYVVCMYLFGGIVLWEHSTSTIHTNMLHVANLRSSLHSLVISYQRFLEGIRNSH